VCVCVCVCVSSAAFCVCLSVCVCVCVCVCMRTHAPCCIALIPFDPVLQVQTGTDDKHSADAEIAAEVLA